MPLQNCVDTHSFLTEAGVVLFLEMETEGMVGESICWTEAKLITDSGMSELSYGQLRDIYKTFTYSKSERMKFWGWMKSMSPESIAEETARSNEEALRRVE